MASFPQHDDGHSVSESESAEGSDSESLDSYSPDSHHSDEELTIKVSEEATVLLRDFIAQEKKTCSPDYTPIEVAVSHLTCTVMAPPPQTTQRSVLTQLNCVEKVRQKKEPLHLVHDVSLYLKPGEMTLLLGAPGCGKSSLIRLLAGNLKVGKRSGSVLFSGPATDKYHRSVSYVPQQDTHIAQLTVKETLQFSANCQMPSWLTSEDRARRVDSILQVLGLTHRANTVVGDALLRGVSGGEKKRVTIGVEAVRNSAVLLLDEPTTGLDSSASYDVLRAVRLIAEGKATVLASLLQPSYDVFSLFDNVLILTHGEVAFFGSRDEAMQHFESLGYRCGAHTNPAEFLQEVAESGAGTLVNPTKYRAEADGDEEQGYEGEDDPHWLTPAEFVEAYKNSSYYERTLKEIDRIASSHQEKTAVEPSSGHKEWRDMATNRSRVISAIAISLITGTLFLQLGDHQTDARTKLGLLFTMIAYFSFSAINTLPGVIDERAVYYYQRSAKYYKPLPYLLSIIIAEIPMTVIETGLFCVISYWMAGLNTAGDRFIYYLLALLAYYFMARAFNRFIACLAPDLQTAQAISPVFTALSTLFGGFIITRTAIPDWWIWAYWVNPTIFVFQGLVANEFWDTTYKCSADELSPPSTVPNFNLPYPEGYSGSQTCAITSGTDYAVYFFDMWNYSWLKWVFLAVLVAFWFIWTFLAYLALLFVRHHPKPATRMREKAVGTIELQEVDIQQIKKDIQERKNNKRKGHNAGQATVTDSGAYLSWNNLNYSVSIRKKLKKKDLQLLHDVCGYVKPGMMLALMGSSGAGKSTLMDVLARRKTGGKITGDIRINGHKADSNLNRIIGYVEQQDLHNPAHTVLEALEFSAICRLPNSISKDQKRKHARSLLTVLGLEKQADMVIGINSQDGISADQRKRVTIGVEMAADPSILFLDEPTSGLDSFGAERVMQAVQNIAARGTPVVCTIHQPSATIFGLFTHLLLLKKGGYTTYFGQIGERPGDCSILLDYFATSLGRHIKPFQNPAEFILEVTGSGLSSATKARAGRSDTVTEATHHTAADQGSDECVTAFRESPFFRETQEALEKGIFPTNHEETDETGRLRKKWRQMKATMKGRYATPFYIQLYETLKRAFLSYWRTPSDFLGKILSPLVMGLIMGTLFLQVENDQRGATERSAVIYFSLILANLISLPLLNRMLVERPVFYREHASRTYNSFVYAITLIAVEWPFCLASTVAFVIPTYFMVGFQNDAGKFWIFFAVLFLNFLVSFALVQALGLLAPNMVMASSFAAIVFTAFALFSGFLITRDNIPRYWIWMHYIDLNMYPLEILVANEMDGLQLHCSGIENVFVPIRGQPAGTVKPFCAVTSGDIFLQMESLDKANMLRNGLVYLGFYMALLLIIVLLVKFVKHQKR